MCFRFVLYTLTAFIVVVVVGGFCFYTEWFTPSYCLTFDRHFYSPLQFLWCKCVIPHPLEWTPLPYSLLSGELARCCSAMQRSWRGPRDRSRGYRRCTEDWSRWHNDVIYLRPGFSSRRRRYPAWLATIIARQFSRVGIRNGLGDVRPEQQSGVM